MILCFVIRRTQRYNLSFLVWWLGWHLNLMIFLSYCCCFSEHFVMRWIWTFLLLVLHSHSSLKRVVAYFSWAGSTFSFIYLFYIFYTEVFFSWWLNVNLNSQYLQAFTMVVLLLLEFKTHSELFLNLGRVVVYSERTLSWGFYKFAEKCPKF